MSTMERILLKLVMIHLIILILVQGFHEMGFLKFTNKLILYEGTAGIEEQPKLNVFNSKE
ncbi:YpfB family protein [Bacillus sp. IITD106]|nr:YpfB family protein [Bacillus sp. IITD106]